MLTLIVYLLLTPSHCVWCSLCQCVLHMFWLLWSKLCLNVLFCFFKVGSSTDLHVAASVLTTFSYWGSCLGHKPLAVNIRTAEVWLEICTSARWVQLWNVYLWKDGTFNTSAIRLSHHSAHHSIQCVLCESMICSPTWTKAYLYTMQVLTRKEGDEVLHAAEYKERQPVSGNFFET